MNLMRGKKIVILGTGGTIAGTAQRATDNIGYAAAQLGVEQLVQAIPGLADDEELVTEQIAQIDSKDMSFSVWVHLAERVNHFLGRDDVQGIVITHGTDTLEETAYFLSVACDVDKPVVLTCAMRPATSVQADGPQNVRDAMTVVREHDVFGVMVVCAGAAHTARDVQKSHTYQLNAFSSGDAGPVGFVEGGRVRWTRTELAGHENISGHAMKKKAQVKLEASWPAVEIVMSYAGARASTVTALVASGVRGLVVAGTGNGTVHQDMELALLDAQARGVRVVRATRCANGCVLPRGDDCFEDSGGLSPVKARIALMLDLMNSAP